MENVSDFYEAFHRERHKEGTVSVPERLEFLREEVGTGKKVVELGCRFGGLLKYFIEGNRVTGVDVDRIALKQCEEKFGIATQIANLNERLPFAAASFDVVVMSEVLEHLPYPNVTLSEVLRILRPAGKFVGSVPNATRLKNRLRFLLTGSVELDRTHLQHFSSRSLAKKLNEYFYGVRVIPVSGRFTFLSKNFFANYLLFCCAKAQHSER